MTLTAAFTLLAKMLADKLLQPELVADVRTKIFPALLQHKSFHSKKCFTYSQAIIHVIQILSQTKVKLSAPCGGLVDSDQKTSVVVFIYMLNVVLTFSERSKNPKVTCTLPWCSFALAYMINDPSLQLTHC